MLLDRRVQTVAMLFVFACTLQYQQVPPAWIELDLLTSKQVLHLQNRWGILVDMVVRPGGQGSEEAAAEA